jgi:hypothetical protein
MAQHSTESHAAWDAGCSAKNQDNRQATLLADGAVTSASKSPISLWVLQGHHIRHHCCSAGTDTKRHQQPPVQKNGIQAQEHQQSCGEYVMHSCRLHNKKATPLSQEAEPERFMQCCNPRKSSPKAPLLIHTVAA